MKPVDMNPVELHFHVDQLLSRYVQCIDGDDLEQWPDFFTERCLYRIISRENADRGLPIAAIYCDSRGMLHDRVTALRHANIYAEHYYRHIVSSLRVTEVGDDYVAAEANYVVLQTLTDGDTHIYNAGKYLDRVVFDGDTPLYAEKQVIFDTYRIANLMVTPI